MSYSVRDLGVDFTPSAINNNGDVLGYQIVATTSPAIPAIRFANGDAVDITSPISYVTDISDTGLVLAWNGSQPVLFNPSGLTTDPVIVPGFSSIDSLAINGLGNLAGSGRHDASGTQRGFVFDRSKGTVTSIEPTLTPVSAGARRFLRFQDINDRNHAVGVQGSVDPQSLEQLEVPVLWNGATLKSIGVPNFIAGGRGITSNDRMIVFSDGHGFGNDFDAIYDAPTDTLTPFLNGRVADLSSSGAILWEAPLGPVYLTDISGTSQISHLFPAGTGWSDPWAIRMNEAGTITGAATFGGKFHGFILTPDHGPIPKNLKDLIARVVWGIINDAGGVYLIGGRFRPVPPRGLRELLDELPPELSRNIDAAVSKADFDRPNEFRAFTFSIRQVISQYRRQNPRRPTAE